VTISPAMIAAKDAIAAAISNLPGVWGVDIGLREDGEGGVIDETVIRILVEDLANVHPLVQAAIGTSIFPVAILERHFHPLVDTQKHRPLIGGISIAAEHGGMVLNSGTLGGLARVTPGLMASFPGVFSGNELLGISAAHVLAGTSSGAQMGDPVHQPHLAALFRLLPTEPGLQQIKPATPTNGRKQHDFRERVWKRGATTGLTHGEVISAHPVFFSSSMAPMVQVTRDLNDPVFADRGDSGSLVLNGDNQVVGLVIAGDVPWTIGTIQGFTSCWMMPITPICQELLIEF
jgi:hypothetical protein